MFDPLLDYPLHKHGRIRTSDLVTLCNGPHDRPDVRRNLPVRRRQSGSSQQRPAYFLQGARIAAALCALGCSRTNFGRRTYDAQKIREQTGRTSDHVFPVRRGGNGSLGQGLSVGVGMALNAKYLDRLPYRTYVLLGDSEMAEGSQWEALQIAAHYQLDNLVGILDVNRLGQRGETMYGHDLAAYERRIAAFGWRAMTIDGHDLEQICAAYEKIPAKDGMPLMIIAKTYKAAEFR